MVVEVVFSRILALLAQGQGPTVEAKWEVLLTGLQLRPFPSLAPQVSLWQGHGPRSDQGSQPQCVYLWEVSFWCLQSG